ncbi:uncharacterized protein LOC103940603 isoform X3 [Pyrus x bretschneideri]|uniref:uncharacterized protein LOC103940603 isoform X3 n=1 Tax=Pyrus x bretschneideri TaxID=225117 RepID=UPI00202FE2A4|nr:uncharacterized protein LOC103940603 isoform X3 [Pyrus x bretschneideri]
MGADSLSGGSADNSDSVVRKNQFRGVLFKYGPKPIQVAFKTGDHRHQVIFIGGLSDGFLAQNTWNLLQLHWTKRNGHLFNHSCHLHTLDMTLPA